MNGLELENVIKQNNNAQIGYQNTLPYDLQAIIKEYEFLFNKVITLKYDKALYVLEDLQEDDEYLVKTLIELCKYFKEDLENKMYYWKRDSREFAEKQQQKINRLNNLIKNNH